MYIVIVALRFSQGKEKQKVSIHDLASREALFLSKASDSRAHYPERFSRRVHHTTIHYKNVSSKCNSDCLEQLGIYNPNESFAIKDSSDNYIGKSDPTAQISTIQTAWLLMRSVQKTIFLISL